MIALDLDNTIICYDEAFRVAASLLDCLPAVGIAISKPTIKAAALAKGGNDLWTRLQGLVVADDRVIEVQSDHAISAAIRRARLSASTPQ